MHQKYIDQIGEQIIHCSSVLKTHSGSMCDVKRFKLLLNLPLHLRFSFHYVEFNFSFLTLRRVLNLRSSILSFHFFNLKKYLITNLDLNANYLNPLWHKLGQSSCINSGNWFLSPIASLLGVRLITALPVLHAIAMITNHDWLPKLFFEWQINSIISIIFLITYLFLRHFFPFFVRYTYFSILL